MPALLYVGLHYAKFEAGTGSSRQSLTVTAVFRVLNFTFITRTRCLQA
jgi:hypothetical protein